MRPLAFDNDDAANEWAYDLEKLTDLSLVESAFDEIASLWFRDLRRSKAQSSRYPFSVDSTTTTTDALHDAPDDARMEFVAKTGGCIVAVIGSRPGRVKLVASTAMGKNTRRVCVPSRRLSSWTLALLTPEDMSA
jgi:hypothetical protein